MNRAGSGRTYLLFHPDPERSPAREQAAVQILPSAGPVGRCSVCLEKLVRERADIR
ncbi:hypothetical protein [Methanosphaerula palustris]|uniref:hypothetical protein n=1 Tax=Methanosphaerula palustris TaxID=475088 RepID=UPI000325DA34|nr:hypothetical protein [Methanosphaerula palustris]